MNLLSLQPLPKGDALLFLSRCSDMKLFLIVCEARIALLLMMFFFRALLPEILGTRLLFDSGALLYSDVETPWKSLDVPRVFDSVHFYHIAKYGYSHENLCAFFPLLPLILRCMSWLSEHFMFSCLAFLPLSLKMSLVNLLLTGVSAIILRRITILTLFGHPIIRKNRNIGGTRLDEWPSPPRSRWYGHSNGKKNDLNLALWREVGATTLMWILGPAAVFTVIMYTESIFSFVSFLGIYLFIISSQKDRWLGAAAEAGAVLSFFLAACIRSNGIIYIGFVVYPIFLQLFFFATFKRRHMEQYGNNSTIPRWPCFSRCMISFLEVIILALPQFLMNFICYSRFVPLWDEASRLDIGNRFWSFYGKIQERYWNVGFLNFYTYQNIPNVLIGSPVIIFTLRGFLLFYLFPAVKKSLAKTFSSPGTVYTNTRKRFWKRLQFYSPSSYIILESLLQSSNVVCLMFLIFVGIAFLHVNVVNRFVLSSPALYWIWGRQLVWDPWSKWTVFMIRIYVLWNCIGAFFIPNGLPWT